MALSSSSGYSSKFDVSSGSRISGTYGMAICRAVRAFQSSDSKKGCEDTSL
eukprot:CAMPEP_0115875842 /NCGR_PEP_ID=MMETSP0287-20121206/25325_1 /TAXON_ID=412157 /ORGANISM="Chrysochromulina rotalis, Strain UIO044" /LENGTH=50 /DNA_ID=CAMNT_0003331157 /DNA_START=386 /DNA_END=535 /DNA_ORIENTATION=+